MCIAAAWNGWNTIEASSCAPVRFKFKCNLFRAIVQGALLSKRTAFAEKNSALSMSGESQDRLARRLFAVNRRTEENRKWCQLPEICAWFHSVAAVKCTWSKAAQTFVLQISPGERDILHQMQVPLALLVWLDADATSRGQSSDSSVPWRTLERRRTSNPCRILLLGERASAPSTDITLRRSTYDGGEDVSTTSASCLGEASWILRHGQHSTWRPSRFYPHPWWSRPPGPRCWRLGPSR